MSDWVKIAKPAFLSTSICLFVVLHSEDDVSRAAAAADKGVQIFNADVRFGKNLHRLGESAGLIGNADGDDVRQGNGHPLVPQGFHRHVGIVDNDAQNTEIGGVRQRQGTVSILIFR